MKSYEVSGAVRLNELVDESLRNGKRLIRMLERRPRESSLKTLDAHTLASRFSGFIIDYSRIAWLVVLVIRLRCPPRMFPLERLGCSVCSHRVANKFV